MMIMLTLGELVIACLDLTIPATENDDDDDCLTIPPRPSNVFAPP